MDTSRSIREVGDEAKQLIESAEKAIRWVDAHGEEVAKAGLKNSLKSTRRNLKKVVSAASKRPAVAIFGQSQVGKSYLVQNLTKPARDTYLQIYIAGKSEPTNFLTDMNPVGGKESTGTVTRFTLDKGNGTAEHPIKVELFEQLDVAAILANAYLSDLKDIQYERAAEDTETIKGRFVELTSTNGSDQGLTEDDAYLFTDYILTNFKGSTLIHDLKDAGYFSEFKQHICKIPFADRVKVLELLWNKNEFFSTLFTLLCEGISTLKFSKEVHVDERAVAPNDTTILDVARVNEMYDTAINSPEVGAKLEDGSSVRVSRSVFSALTKEVELTIANSFEGDNDRLFIELCDVLDFPGSKSREKVPEVVFNANNPEQKMQLFIRGKVSYLFDTYTDSQGVSSLLYCMDDTPPEEKEAPARLKKWVNKYVGVSPSDRKLRVQELSKILAAEGVAADHVSPLMVVLTKFNVELDKVVPGKELDMEFHNTKWYARLQENFIKFMHLSVEDRWINNWDGEEKAFKFVFPMRDPLYSQTTFAGFDQHKRETEIRPERVETVDVMGRSFLGSKQVHKLIPEPEKVWSELTTPNGSGISHLCKYLAPATHPVVTRVRLQAELKKGRKDLINTLKPHLISGDLNEDLKKAELDANLCWTALMGLSIRSDSLLSLILKSMVVTDVEIWKLMYDFKFLYDAEHQSARDNDFNLSAAVESFRSLGVEIKVGMTNGQINEVIRENLFPSYSDEQVEDTILNMTGIRISDLVFQLNKNKKVDQAEEFAAKVIEFWHQKMLSAAQNEALMGQLNEHQKDSMVSVINEIVKGRNKFSLGRRISDITRPLVSGAVGSKDFDLVSTCCSSILNRYLFSAGWAFAEETEKPVSPMLNEPIFSKLSKLKTNMNIGGYDANKHERRFLHQWALGCKQLYSENVKYEYDVQDSFDGAANTALATILEAI
jgi:hypothetical protein